MRTILSVECAPSAWESWAKKQKAQMALGLDSPLDPLDPLDPLVSLVAPVALVSPLEEVEGCFTDSSKFRKCWDAMQGLILGQVPVLLFVSSLQ